MQRDQYGDLDVDGRTMLKLIFRGVVSGCGLNIIGSGLGPVVGSSKQNDICEHRSHSWPPDFGFMHGRSNDGTDNDFVDSYEYPGGHWAAYVVHYVLGPIFVRFWTNLDSKPCYIISKPKYFFEFMLKVHKMWKMFQTKATEFIRCVSYVRLIRQRKLNSW
jgi:hypothetical protein